MLGAMADGLKGGNGLRLPPRLLPGVGVAVEPGEVAAGHFQADLVAFQENVAGGHQVDGVLVYLIIPPLLLILFRNKYPRWWFDWSVELMRFESRVTAYALLLRDEYPSTDEEQSVHLEVPYPDVPQDLNRWLPLVKWILAIPHYIVLIVLGFIAMVVVIVAWFAILFTGWYPRGLFNYIEGVMRWGRPC